ncbi:hypothetical protein AURDEDRAFT_154405 [Auricularia subglabra TFB-10046 SS5]|nr:hypothetical protein AURDEDRAFT_154405 [Auricularia subglabra TFB-10046 SS5]
MCNVYIAPLPDATHRRLEETIFRIIKQDVADVLKDREAIGFGACCTVDRIVYAARLSREVYRCNHEHKLMPFWVNLCAATAAPPRDHRTLAPHAAASPRARSMTTWSHPASPGLRGVYGKRGAVWRLLRTGPPCDDSESSELYRMAGLRRGGRAGRQVAHQNGMSWWLWLQQYTSWLRRTAWTMRSMLQHKQKPTVASFNSYKLFVAEPAPAPAPVPMAVPEVELLTAQLDSYKPFAVEPASIPAPPTPPVYGLQQLVDDFAGYRIPADEPASINDFDLGASSATLVYSLPAALPCTQHDKPAAGLRDLAGRTGCGASSAADLLCLSAAFSAYRSTVPPA